MGFSTDGGMALLQSAFKEAFVVSVVYGKCVDPDACHGDFCILNELTDLGRVQ